ncbi:hypothetical protein [Agarivorans gilvus]|uniref:DUF1240 domain-containing protein n=1 Tax=Agarivorans gilvus TaxID=680279 RepID=A0ABQ1I625_9ALTE|nr:hypothetical protein [Agarivorans gilvus]GGB12431.1 hypothetical protein GCM10007414_27240 [Agarivorans gilvus]
MTDPVKKKIRLLYLTICIATLSVPMLTFIIVDGKLLSKVTNQLSMKYPVIYIDVGYCYILAGIFVLANFILAAALKSIELKNKSVGKFARSIKVLTILMLASTLIAFPGKAFEKWRVEKLVSDREYKSCPEFTLLFGKTSINVWVNDFSLCHDPEVDKLARYGYPDEPAKIAKMLADRELMK